MRSDPTSLRKSLLVLLICNLLAAILLPLGSIRAITSLRSFENALLAKTGQQSAQLRAAEKIEEADVKRFTDVVTGGTEFLSSSLRKVVWILLITNGSALIGNAYAAYYLLRRLKQGSA